jgi:YHS domain-containing protein
MNSASNSASNNEYAVSMHGWHGAGRWARAWLALPFALLLALALSACGTPYATSPSASSGLPVMLLGHDPVAYFTRNQATRGNPTWRVDLPERSYYFATAEHKAIFEAAPSKYEPQYGGFCASGAAFAIKLGSDPGAWVIRDGRLFIFGDVLGQTAWELDPAWNIAHADRLWPDIKDKGWRAASLTAYASKVPHYLSGAQIRAQWQAQNPGKTYPSYNPGGMIDNLFFKQPGWRAAEGFGQTALGYAP